MTKLVETHEQRDAKTIVIHDKFGTLLSNVTAIAIIHGNQHGKSL
ncbi:predicted protein [Sclerotinia sclerotiorum 1980 UF-70]|uniref:Uncharacterized protein n=1 Tax=Sclerotinia sclerotiorum (strain ATCC 18683 / 1980 / Ss-1) TaxID=665079 RepID=A7EH10_SCLS1|nr:predicted protein [Sclerotinia sclerotiorum 1980 UF-70]EDO02126.1 predicted protein [Sclerotinia sclerotiorum 1980 UF-70]